MTMELETLLEKLEDQGDELKDVRQLAPLIVFLITQQRDLFGKMNDVLDRLASKEIPKTDIAPIVDALEKLIKKEVKVQKVYFPEVQRVVVEGNPESHEGGLAMAGQEILLKEILEALKDLKNEERTIVIENKVPHDIRPLPLPVTGMGPAEFRKYKARYHKINVKPQEAADGSRTIFTLIHLPEAGTDECWVGGIKLTQDAGDYTLVGQTVTFTTAPASQPYFDYDVI